MATVKGKFKKKIEKGKYRRYVFRYITFLVTIKKKIRDLSPQANYTDRAADAGRRSYRQLLRIEGCQWSAQRIPTAVNLFSGPEPLLFIQVAPQLTSRG